MKTTVTYTGPLASGYVQCPNTLKSYPFKNGAAFDLPEDLAANIKAQSPNDWSVSPVIQKMVDAKNAAPVQPVTETASTDENTEEKV